MWAWASSGTVHNVTFDDAAPSGNQGSGTFERTFAAAGSFPTTAPSTGQIMSGVIHGDGRRAGDGGAPAEAVAAAGVVTPTRHPGPGGY